MSRFFTLSPLKTLKLERTRQLETFAEPKKIEINPNYHQQRQQNQTKLTDDMIDAPIVHIINKINKRPHCFTLQCCYGHFIYNHQKDPHNFDPLPETEKLDKIEYRIAYLAFCIDNNEAGENLLDTISRVTLLSPENIQLGSPKWFWQQQVNSYVLQVEPNRYKYEDRIFLEYQEALKIEKIRNAFFNKLNELLG
ncbi:MAG: hypothetical protein PVI90_11680 [Desulfobacteraceae bacterium]|jgi:hypothetical protein